jgi:hypothetical protein
MDFVVVSAYRVVDYVYAVDHDLPGELHSQLLDHAKRSGIGRVGAGVDARQHAILETVTQSRPGGFSRNSLPPMFRRDAVKDFDFARDAAVFGEMA